MDHFNDLPKRHENHVTESRAEAAFNNLLINSEDFVLQSSDRKDYGTDCQIEVIDRGSATNIRIHVQLKGTEKATNGDGSVSIEIRRSNLNYLLMQSYSLFVCYHIPTDTLWFCSASKVLRQYEHSGQNWFQQKTITITFSEILTSTYLQSFAALAKSGAVLSRTIRVAQTTANAEDIPNIIRSSIPELHVPEDASQAAKVLFNLYESGMDEVVSTAFEKFAAILSYTHAAMIFCYMSEINLGMARAGGNNNIQRIKDSIYYLMSELNAGRYYVGSIYYSIGNAFAALGQEEEAVKAYVTALEHLSDNNISILAMCYKNLGTSYEKLGNEQKAVEFFSKALYLNPQLPEAHYALGLYSLHKGEYEDALENFDKVIFADHTSGKQFSVSGWRINALFNLNEGGAAFRDINLLLSDIGDKAWIWLWCARQVASFGRASVNNAKLSMPFWDRYLNAHPNCPRGIQEWLLCRLYLRSEGQNIGLTYWVFKAEFVKKIQYVIEKEEAAYLWDRLGHWAQDENNWEEAEYCFRGAYDLGGGHYGYCFGTALNFLERPEESLPILLDQANNVQPDDMSWFQVGVAYAKLGQVRESIDAYQKAITLNPNYDLAWFNMGGVHWNAGEWIEASHVWKMAVEKFPNHELAALLHKDISFLLE